MNAVYKNELRGYFRGMFGWIAAAAMILASGAVAAVVNLLSSSADFSYLFASLPDALVLLLPCVASRTFTRENAYRNSVWLGSLPVSRTEQITGKYFAAFTLFLLPTAVLAVFPPLLDSFGAVSYGSAYTALFGYILLGAALLAICSFTSSRFHLRLVSVAVNVLLCLALYFLPLLSAVFYALPLIAFLVCVLICIAVGAYIAVKHKKIVAAVLTAVLPSLLFTLLYFLLPAFFSRVLPIILDRISLFDRLGGFRAGHFDLPATVLYLGTAVLFVFLTVWIPASSDRKERRAK